MKKISRWMSAAPVHKTPGWGYVVLAGILIAFGYVVYLWPWILLLAALFVVVVCVDRSTLRAQARKRSGESICTFVRAFDCHQTDTWILRAVYEELSQYLQIVGKPFPIHAEDRWEEDLKIDHEDMDYDLLPDIAYRAQRTLENTEQNPFYNKVKTVRDLICFLENQPKIENVEHSA